MVSRRSLFPAVLLAVPGFLPARAVRPGALQAALARLEAQNGGRLGVAVLDTATGERADYRAEELFPLCSTFKFLLAAAVLKRIDGGEETLARKIPIPAPPLLFNSPLTEPHAGGTLSVAELCHAALTRSDNTAANLLLDSLGGPPAITRFCRSIGDAVTRLDRTETALNEALAGDPRDTTSPRAMVADLRSVLLGAVLSDASRLRLTRWMEANVTGLDRLRAALPAGWRAADKTGANGEHTSNDIAVFWPPRRPPLVVAAYITQCPGPESKRAALLAKIGQLALQGRE